MAKQGKKVPLEVTLKQRILRTILVSVMKHRGDATIRRNGCLTLLQFKIPDDLVRWPDSIKNILSYDHERMSTFLFI